MKLPYQIVDGTAIIVLRTDTGVQPVTVSAEHPSHKEIIQALVSDEHDLVMSLLDARKTAVEKVKKSLDLYVDDDHVTVDIDGNVTYNNLPLEPFIAQCIKDRVQTNASCDDLIRFRRRLDRNSTPKIREQLFQFLNHGGFQLLPDGRFVAYKGVHRTTDPKIFQSCHDRDFYYELGVKIYENVKPCDYDVDSACGSGLHVGTKSFAVGYGDTMLEVFVDPAEVICVPKDSGGQKLRAKALFCNEVIERSTAAPTSTIREALDEAGVEFSDDCDIDDDDLDDRELSEDADHESDPLGDEVRHADLEADNALRQAKSSKRTYYNTYTGASIRAEKSPGPGWSSTKPKKPVAQPGGARTYYNRDTGESVRTLVHPGPGWTSHKPKG